jgi:hypothetical protein
MRSVAFNFRAGACALGGRIVRPFSEPLEVQAASFLPPSGGYGSARREGFRFHEIVSFRAGYTQVIGSTHESEDGKSIVHETLASAVVEELNILDIVTADRVVARLTSEYPSPDDSGELGMLPRGSYFVNLRVAGMLISDGAGQDHLTPDRALLESATRKAIEKSCGGRHEPAGQEARSGFPKRLRMPLFDFDATQVPGVAKDKCSRLRIEIPAFGTIVLGEFIVAESHRQLTMVRVHLHSPGAGYLDVASLEGNGSTPS